MSAAEPKTAFVTGSAQGIGFAITQVLLASRHRVVMADIDEQCNLAAASKLDPTGERTHAMCLDVRDPDASADAFEQAVRLWGSVDVLVNNAAILGNTSIWDLTMPEWDSVIATNLRAVFVLSRAAGSHMRARGSGRIVNLASLAGQTARPSGTAYAASKAGVVALTRSFALELAPYGITVNTVAPGMTETPMVDGVTSEVRAQLVGGVPLGRIIDAPDVAAVVAFLASDEAASITGATYDINGGALMR